MVFISLRPWYRWIMLKPSEWFHQFHFIKLFHTQKLPRCVLPWEHISRGFSKADLTFLLITAILLIQGIIFFFLLSCHESHCYFPTLIAQFFSLIFFFLQSHLNISVFQYSIFNTFLFLFSSAWVFVCLRMAYIVSFELITLKYLL